jgi:hypothetical protein
MRTLLPTPCSPATTRTEWSIDCIDANGHHLNVAMDGGLTRTAVFERLWGMGASAYAFLSAQGVTLTHQVVTAATVAERSAWEDWAQECADAATDAWDWNDDRWLDAPTTPETF